jgi:hypothetical protein
MSDLSCQGDTPMFTKSLQFRDLNHNNVNVRYVRFAARHAEAQLSSAKNPYFARVFWMSER